MTPSATRPLPAGLTPLLALACGVIVANIYYVQPLLGLVAGDYGMDVAAAGLFVTVTQLGYAAGLLLVVPLGDVAENRRLIAGMLALLVAALGAATLAPNAACFLAASLLIGLCASTVQVVVPLAGHLAPEARRGHVVGTVVGGLLFGIMLARPMASFTARVAGHRTIFALSAVAAAVLGAALWRALPDRRPAGMPYRRALASLGPLFLRTPVLWRRGGYQAALFGAFSLFWTAVPLLLAGPRFGFTQFGIGVFALAGAAGALVSPHAGRAADAGRGRLVTRLSLAAGVLAFPVALAGGAWSSWPLLAAAALLLDMGAAGHLVTGQQAVFAIDPAARGRLNGLYLATFFVGGAFGSFVSSLVFARAGWPALCAVGLAMPLAALAVDCLAPARRAA